MDHLHHRHLLVSRFSDHTKLYPSSTFHLQLTQQELRQFWLPTGSRASLAAWSLLQAQYLALWLSLSPQMHAVDVWFHYVSRQIHQCTILFRRIVTLHWSTSCFFPFCCGSGKDTPWIGIKPQFLEVSRCRVPPATDGKQPSCCRKWHIPWVFPADSWHGFSDKHICFFRRISHISACQRFQSYI